MRIYLSYCGNKIVHDWFNKYDLGWGFSLNNQPRTFKGPFFLDNGIFTVYRHNLENPDDLIGWDEVGFYEYLRFYQQYKPDFTVIPDLVAEGMKSFEHSLSHLNKIPRPRYLAVQDGMFLNCIHQWLLSNSNTIDGLFVGGTVDWKRETGKSWCNLAHLHNLKCHIGRIGSYEGYRMCDYWGADSVDGSNPSRNRNEEPIRKYYDWKRNQKTLDNYILMDCD